MKKRVFLGFIFCIIGLLFGCTKKEEINNGNIAPVKIEDQKTQNTPENKTEISIESIIGKKIFRSAQGPDDTASFKITILENGNIEGDSEESVSWATGILYFENGHWTYENDELHFSLKYTGQISQPKENGYEQVENSQKIGFSIKLQELGNSKEEKYEYLGNIDY